MPKSLLDFIRLLNEYNKDRIDPILLYTSRSRQGINAYVLRTKSWSKGGIMIAELSAMFNDDEFALFVNKFSPDLVDFLVAHSHQRGQIPSTMRLEIQNESLAIIIEGRFAKITHFP